MVTYEDCLALAELTPEEVDRVVVQAGLPAIVALELASHLAKTTEGKQAVRRITGTEAAGARGHAPREAIPTTIPTLMLRRETKRVAA
jgi:hypothetical protein